jgi:hypothetical protein
MEGGTMFRFTIRELLILTVTAGLAVGWWLDRARLAESTDSWRTIAGGLEHVMEARGWQVGVDGGRIWVATKGPPRRLVGEVGLREFEPKLAKGDPPPQQLPFYYSNWPRRD